MEESNIWIIGLVALVVGAIVGYLVGRSGSDAGQRQSLSRQLDDAREELATYKQQVTDHFEKTADLVNQLTNTYKDVHQHLASGAQSLCVDQKASQALKDSMQPRLEAPDETATAPAEPRPDAKQTDHAEPPRDYAAKAADEEGTLSESYGFSRKQTGTEESEPDEAPAASSKEAPKTANPAAN